MKKRSNRHARKIIFTAVATFCASTVFAQGMLEEVIVTAQKRETTLSDTPIAITAMSAEQIKNFGLVATAQKTLTALLAPLHMLRPVTSPPFSANTSATFPGPEPRSRTCLPRQLAKASTTATYKDRSL